MKKSFLKFPLKLILAVLVLGSSFSAIAQEKLGGLALYTVRDAMGKDAKGTLQAVADAGYKNIEAAGYENGTYYSMSPTAFKAMLKELKLKPMSTHQSSITLDKADVMFADAKAAGFKYFVVPVPPMGYFKYYQETQSMGMTCSNEELATILTTLGKKAKTYGLKLLYHNHDFEFKKDKDGIVPIEYLLENTDPKYVNFQMDLFWVTKAGADPVDYFNKYPKRFKSWHVKDMDDEGRFAPVGNGNIDFEKILANKKLSGMKYYMVEQDRTFNMEPLEAIKVSRKALKQIGFK
ncbi:sugar phosphate isomerase/epimerase [Saonia flava]|uniref:Sugar phosphate isomerase/epimerase n=1 Tax=Saonia flava TaxID=523696 RepID=A0A846QSL5_9FLAO|nr:sugar phosphate isomerase/epimerase [Saonia flava]NJB69950.1 sugar phosphate isomerase/epimerase [Saonia flava]